MPSPVSASSSRSSRDTIRGSSRGPGTRPRCRLWPWGPSDTLREKHTEPGDIERTCTQRSRNEGNALRARKGLVCSSLLNSEKPPLLIPQDPLPGPPSTRGRPTSPNISRSQGSLSPSRGCRPHAWASSWGLEPRTELPVPKRPAARESRAGGPRGRTRSECKQPFQGQIIPRPPSSLPREMHAQPCAHSQRGKLRPATTSWNFSWLYRLGVGTRGYSVPRIMVRHLRKS